MADMQHEVTITPSIIDKDKDPRPVRIQYGNVKMRLPRLDDSTQIPLALLTAGLTVVSRGWDNLTREEQLRLLAAFLAYLCREYPALEREMDKKSGDKIKDIGQIIQAWGAWGDTDPKA